MGQRGPGPWSLLLTRQSHTHQGSGTDAEQSLSLNPIPTLGTQDRAGEGAQETTVPPLLRRTSALHPSL